MTEPTKAMRAAARELVRRRWNNTFDGYPVEVEACAIGMAHAAALIEKRLEEQGHNKCLDCFCLDNAAEEIARGDWLKEETMLNEDTNALHLTTSCPELKAPYCGDTEIKVRVHEGAKVNCPNCGEPGCDDRDCEETCCSGHAPCAYHSERQASRRAPEPGEGDRKAADAYAKSLPSLARVFDPESMLVLTDQRTRNAFAAGRASTHTPDEARDLRAMAALRKRRPSVFWFDRRLGPDGDCTPDPADAILAALGKDDQHDET